MLRDLLALEGNQVGRKHVATLMTLRIYARYRGAPEYQNVLRAVEKVPTVLMDHYQIVEEVR